MALIEARRGSATLPGTRVPLRPALSLDDLEAALGEADAEERRRVDALFNGVLAAELSVTTDEAGVPTVEGLGGAEQPFVGQCVRDGNRVLYCSLVASETWA